MSHFPINRVHQHLYRPHFGYVVMPLVRSRSNHNTSAVTNPPRLNSLQTVDIKADERQISIEEALAISWNDIEDLKEKQRRKKIGLANKGHVPWNKGRQHDAETRERIKQRTREALKDPKVRQKMVECRRAHSHSEKVKRRIGSSLRLVWAKRLKWKRSREKFYNSWAESIVEAAQMGRPEQETEEKEVVAIAIQSEKPRVIRKSHKERRKEKEKLKWKRSREKFYNSWAESIVEMAQVGRPEQEAEEKEVPVMAIQSEKPRVIRKSHKERRKEKEEKEKLKRKMKLERRDSKMRLKLKERLRQIRQKVSNYGNVPCTKGRVTSHIQAWEKLDLELVKSESFKREVSLADQIRAAKNKKGEISTTKALTS